MRLFDFEEERLKQEIQRLGAKKVLLQLPEGLKPEGPRLAKIVEKSGALPIISADACYGACDLATSDAEDLDADLVVHYGHSRLVKFESVPTLYIEARATGTVDEAVEKALPLLKKWRKIGLATTVQHVQALDGAKDLLISNGKMVEIGDAGRLSYAGQVIGCDYSNVKSITKDVQAFLFIGGGRFHALGVALATTKPTIVADPYDKRAFSVDSEARRIIKQRWASIKEAQKAKSMAIVIGLKPGQKQFDRATEMKTVLEAAGKNVFLFATREVTPELMMEFPSVDAYVNTACPRISIDDASKFKKPMLNLNEANVVAGRLSWEELCRRGLLEN